MGVDPARVAVERNQRRGPARHLGRRRPGRRRQDRDRRLHRRRLGRRHGAHRHGRPAGARRPDVQVALAHRDGQVPDARGGARGDSAFGGRNRHRGAPPRRPDPRQAQRPRHHRSQAPHHPPQHRRLLHRRGRHPHLPPGARAGDRRHGEAGGHRRRADAVPGRRGDAGSGAGPGQGGLRRPAVLHGRPDPGAGSWRTSAARR